MMTTIGDPGLIGVAFTMLHFVILLHTWKDMTWTQKVIGAISLMLLVVFLCYLSTN